MAQVRGESAIIQGFLAELADYPGAFGLVDDCAELAPAPEQAFVVKTDPVRAGVHFFPDDDAADIAWKALAVNVSDLAAKAARPFAYLLATSFPEAPSEAWLRSFSRGLSEAQSAFGLTLVGGDTDRADGPLSIAVTVIGEVPTGRMVRRGTARPGDLIYVSGTLGAAAVGLKVRSGEVENDRCDPAVDDALARFLRPRPRLGLKAALRRCARAAMDLSDGLAKDLGRMAHASGCGAVVDVPAVPCDPAAYSVAPRVSDALMQLVLGHGDDYEILVAVPQGEAARFEALALAGGVGVTQIGKFVSEMDVRFDQADGARLVLSSRGYDHF